MSGMTKYEVLLLGGGAVFNFWFLGFTGETMFELVSL